MKSVLVLFSGGADSTLLLCRARQVAGKVGALLFDYGQIHAAELDVAEKFLEEQGLVNEKYRMSLPFYHTTSPLLMGHGCAPRAGVHEMHVPSRNLVFIAHAASIAESGGYDEIWYGADFSDSINRFPDCTQEWVGKMGEVLAINGSRPLRLRAPLLGMTKDDVLDELAIRGITHDRIFSGYGESR